MNLNGKISEKLIFFKTVETLTYLTSRSKILPNAFIWDFFRKFFLTLLKPKALFSHDMLNQMRQWLYVSKVKVDL